VEEQSLMEGEIDLRAYIEVLIRWWREIIVLTLLAAVTAGLVSYPPQPPTYQAQSLLAVVKTWSEITFEPNYLSISEEDLGVGSSAGRKSRLESFAKQVKNPEIAQSILEMYPDLFLPETPEADPVTALDVLEMVEGEVVGESDMIAVLVTADDPEKASIIANAWGRALETTINQLYGQETVPLRVIEPQVGEARADYQAAEEALREFTANEDRIGEMERLVGEKETIIISLRSGKGTAVSAVIDGQIAAQKALIDAQVSLQQELVGVLVKASAANNLRYIANEQVSEKLSDLSQAFARKDRYLRFLIDANVMLDSVEQGGDASAASNSLALQLLKAEVLATSADLPGVLQVQLPAAAITSTAVEQGADVRALVSVLETQLDLLDQEIVLLSDELLQGADYSFLDESSIGVVGLSGASPLAASLTDLTDMQLEGGGQRLLTLDGLKELLGPSVQETLLTQQIVLMEQEVRELRAEIAHLQSVKKDLEQVRDLAWHTYTTVSTKVAELALASQSVESEIRFTVESVPPREPEESRHPMTTVALAGAVGLMLAVGMAFLLDFMDQEPVIMGWWKARRSPGQ
jgi:capsular polysaccharide biosynthesis protein